jgi:hypothetical protein
MFEPAESEIEVLGARVRIRTMSRAEVSEYRQRIADAGEDRAAQEKVLAWLVATCTLLPGGGRAFEDAAAALAIDHRAFGALLRVALEANWGPADPTSAPPATT